MTSIKSLDKFATDPAGKTTNTFDVKTSNRHTMFVPAFIDDYGFNCEEFRVFSRIMRRSVGSSESCFESIPRLAKSLFISERLVRRALNVLEACEAIERTVRPGKSDVYDFNPMDKWKPSSELPAIRRRIDSEIKRKDRARKEAKSAVVVAETIGVTPCGNATTPLAETTPPVVAETTDEGTPIEGYPKKEQKHPAQMSAKSTDNHRKHPSAALSENSLNTPLSKKGMEPDAEYLARKQSEFPQHDIIKLFERFCEVRSKNNQPIVRAVFDVWCQKEEAPMSMPSSPHKSDPAIVTAEAEKFLLQKYGGLANK